MRIPLTIVTLLLLIIPLSIWFTGTSKYDFMTPRDIPDHELRPDFASPVALNIKSLLASSPTALAPKPTPPPITEIELGDLAALPTLDAYFTSTPQSALSLFKLAETLEDLGKNQRAALAYERILDSTPAHTTYYLQAEVAAKRLKSKLPEWFYNSVGSRPLEIHLSSDLSEDSLQKISLKLTEFIALSSSHICQPSFTNHTTSIGRPSSSESESPQSEIMIWLTVEGEDPENPAFEKITVSFHDEIDSLNAVSRGLYQLISQRIQSIAKLNPLPELNEEEPATSALIHRITRLAWHQVISTPFLAIEASTPQLSSESRESPQGGEDE